MTDTTDLDYLDKPLTDYQDPTDLSAGVYAFEISVLKNNDGSIIKSGSANGRDFKFVELSFRAIEGIDTQMSAAAIKKAYPVRKTFYLPNTEAEENGEYAKIRNLSRAAGIDPNMGIMSQLNLLGAKARVKGTVDLKPNRKSEGFHPEVVRTESI